MADPRGAKGWAHVMRGGAARAAQRREGGRRADAPDAGEAATGTAAGTWLVRGADGRLTAYAPRQGGLLRWTETTAGGDGWTGPDALAADGLTHLSVAQGADAFVHFLGRREQPCADGGVAVDVVYALQYQTGRPLTDWVSVGNPHVDPERARRIGAPVVAVDASGRVQVFVRSADGGVMVRCEGRGGKWEAWRDLRGRGVRDGLAAVVSPAGRLELLAPAETSALHWIQAEAGGVLRRSLDVRPAPVPGSVAAVATAPDRLTYLWTDAAGSGLVAHRRGAGSSRWAAVRRPARPTPYCGPCWTTRTAWWWPTGAGTGTRWSGSAVRRPRPRGCGGWTPVCPVWGRRPWPPTPWGVSCSRYWGRTERSG